MRCPRCGHDNGADLKFCGECGTRLGLLCAECGARNSPSQKFCGECGARLTARTPSRAPSPESYTPKHLAEKILTSKAALEGERKQVTVLFADLKGSMELLADRDPEEARKLLDPVLERMMEAVHRYEGTVNQVMGDGIMALFGAPLAHEDHAVRACCAALRMQESVKKYADEMRRSHAAVVKIRVGLNSGEVVVRAIGSDLHMDYTAVGQTTHLAARMEQLAEPGSTLVTETFVRLTQGYLHFKPLGLVAVKGLAEPVEVFELVDAQPTRGRFQAAARGLTHFVGRRSEFEALERALDRARSGHGQALAVIGEPGVGKSRLYYEFIDSPPARGCAIMETCAVSYGKLNAYFPLRELLRTFFQVEDRDDPRAIHDKLSGRLTQLDESLHGVLPALAALLDVPLEDQTWRELDPSLRRQRMHDGLKRLLIRLSQEQPLIVMVENLHWIDAETQAFLDALIEGLPTARILLLVNYRPEYQHGWSSKSYYGQLRLDPLSPDGADEFLSFILGDDPELHALKKLLIERTEGNPFFLEECIRTLVETKALVGERGACRLRQPLSKVQVPVTVQAILAARIDRLSPEDKRVLQCAAVIGKDVAFPLLRAVANAPEEELRQSLAQLQTAEFLYEQSLFPELEYTFKHALTQEVAYATLLLERRRELHARTVQAIETVHADRLANQVDRLADHAFRGAMWEKAVTYFRRAGAKAAMNSAYREAVAWLERGLEALANLPERREVLEQAIDLRLDLRNSLLPLGEHQRILDRLGEAEKFAISLGDQRRVGWVSANMARQLVLLGDPKRAAESAERAQILAVAHSDFALQVTATSVLGQAHYAQGAYGQAIEELSRNVATLEGDRRRERLGLAGLPSVMSRTFLAFCLAEVGDFDKAKLCSEEALRLAEGVDHSYSLAHALFGIGHVCLRRGDFQTAVSFLERGFELCEAKSIRFAVPRTASSLGYAYAISGRLLDGLRLLERAIEEAETMRVRYSQALWMTWRAEAVLLAGRTGDAVPLGLQALGVARAHGELGHEAWAQRLLGQLFSQRDHMNAMEAETAYREAFALAQQLGMRPLLAQCELGLGLLYGQTGRDAEARSALEAAIQMLRALGMTFWLSRAEAALANG